MAGRMKARTTFVPGSHLMRCHFQRSLCAMLPSLHPGKKQSTESLESKMRQKPDVCQKNNLPTFLPLGQGARR